MLQTEECNLGVSWPVRNFLWIDDLVELYRVLLDQLPVGETFVTGPDNALTIEALVNLIGQKLRWGGVVNWGTVPERAAEVPYLNSDASKAKAVLGWEPKVSLDEGLDRVIAVWRNNPDGATEPTWEEKKVYWRQFGDPDQVSEPA
jgi:nucleoside-diphosphate-sugar epimerase